MKAIAVVLSVSACSAAVLPARLGEASPEPSYANYAPIKVQCPSDQEWIRSAKSISPQEAEWVAGRKVKVADALHTYLTGLNLKNFDVPAYVEALRSNYSNVPTIGLTISGGGYASGLTGTGVLRAMDGRFGPAVEHRTGGLLQSMTYLSGLSGGAWPVMGLTTYNNPKIDDMVAAWQVNVSRPSLNGPGSSIAPNYTSLVEEIAPKAAAGYNISIDEFLGRAYAYEFAAGPKGAMGMSFSNVPFISNFANHDMPFPMFQAVGGEANDEQFYGLQVPYYNATIYEMTPFEFGAWDGPEAFFPMRYLGTKMVDGRPVGDCVEGFDRISYILAAAADAFNFWYIESASNHTLAPFSKRSTTQTLRQTVSSIKSTAQHLNKRLSGFALIDALGEAFVQSFHRPLSELAYTSTPNPFALSNSTATTLGRPTNLTLLDESEAYQALPFWGQVQPARRPDFIMGWDNDQDSGAYAWENGTNMYGSYLYAKEHNIPFPIVPPAATFINLNFTNRPTFFGCEANLTTTGDLQAPIILYMESTPYSSYTNYSWLSTAFSNEQMSVILTNTFNYVTQGNGTLDAEWPECLGCAAIDRSLVRLGMERTEQCQKCMDRYCWDGTINNENPRVVDHVTRLNESYSYAEWNKTRTSDFWPELPERD